MTHNSKNRQKPHLVLDDMKCVTVGLLFDGTQYVEKRASLQNNFLAKNTPMYLDIPQR